ncbi:MAG: hypothetical protein DRR15_13310 [Gammaproteobacteria bacterium]|nr:MAG: hypothetical protein DRR15_13310 [Gammaproteobacteria bacterium]
MKYLIQLFAIIFVVTMMVDGSTNQVFADQSEGQLYPALKEFFIQDEWEFDESEFNGNPVISARVSGDVGEWEFLVIAMEEKSLVLFYSILDENVPMDRRQAIADFITRANYDLWVGNFEQDMRDGEVRYKTSIVTEGGNLSADVINSAVYANIETMNEYFSGIQGVATKYKIAAHAIAGIEGGTVDLDANLADVEKLLSASGAGDQLLGFQDEVLSGLEEGQKKTSGALSDDEYAALRGLFQNQFASTRLHEDVTRIMQERWSAAYAESAMDWLNSSLGVNITEKESLSSSPEWQKTIAEYAETEAFSRQKESRLALIENLDEATGATEIFVDLFIAMRFSIMMGMSLADSELQELKLSELRTQVESERDEMVLPIKEYIKTSYLYMYRDFSDDDIQQYINFLESDAGRWYVTVLSDAIAEALINAGVAVGESFPDLIKAANKSEST